MDRTKSSQLKKKQNVINYREGESGEENKGNICYDLETMCPSDTDGCWCQPKAGNGLLMGANLSGEGVSKIRRGRKQNKNI